MNKPQKIQAIGAKPAPLTEEQKIAALYRGYAQKFESVAQGALFNLINNPSAFATAIADPGQIAKSAIAIASAYMEQVGPAVDAGFLAVKEQATEKKEEK